MAMNYESETSYKQIILFHKWTVPNTSFFKNSKDFMGFASKVIRESDYGYCFQLQLQPLENYHLSEGLLSVLCIKKGKYSACYKVQIHISGHKCPVVAALIPNTVKVKLSLESLLDLIIECYITITMLEAPSVQLVKVPESQLSKHIGALFNTTEYSDVTIVTADLCEIPAHKIILSADSKVFADMLSGESQTNRVIIDDFCGKVVEELLRFIYTGVAPNLDFDKAKDLLAAADKYDIQRLKALCLNYLFDHLSIKTAAMTFNLAHKYNEKRLLSKTVEYIKRNYKDVKGTEEWQNIVQMNPVQLMDIFLGF
ncbi:PREDICTED: protein roadkill-like [Drosophila arizonae]|uniref:Protein roadkill-like n=1 Tax=Drosophila arizonae TaxID=7263 RepID=A0ABM1NVU5_DROAR|nr:PREDICTED: protein roadkill-like [Drosophila arizonae]